MGYPLATMEIRYPFGYNVTIATWRDGDTHLPRKSSTDLDNFRTLCHINCRGGTSRLDKQTE